MLQWARANGCDWDATTCLSVADEGSAMREWIQAQLRSTRAQVRGARNRTPPPRTDVRLTVAELSPGDVANAVEAAAETFDLAEADVKVKRAAYVTCADGFRQYEECGAMLCKAQIDDVMSAESAYRQAYRDYKPRVDPQHKDSAYLVRETGFCPDSPYDQAGKLYASQAVQCHPHGGQFDLARLPARTMHPHGGASYVW